MATLGTTQPVWAERTTFNDLNIDVIGVIADFVPMASRVSLYLTNTALYALVGPKLHDVKYVGVCVEAVRENSPELLKHWKFLFREEKGLFQGLSSKGEPSSKVTHTKAVRAKRIDPESDEEEGEDEEGEAEEGEAEEEVEEESDPGDDDGGDDDDEEPSEEHSRPRVVTIKEKTKTRVQRRRAAMKEAWECAGRLGVAKAAVKMCKLLSFMNTMNQGLYTRPLFFLGAAKCGDLSYLKELDRFFSFKKEDIEVETLLSNKAFVAFDFLLEAKIIRTSYLGWYDVLTGGPEVLDFVMSHPVFKRYRATILNSVHGVVATNEKYSVQEWLECIYKYDEKLWVPVDPGYKSANAGRYTQLILHFLERDSKFVVAKMGASLWEYYTPEMRPFLLEQPLSTILFTGRNFTLGNVKSMCKVIRNLNVNIPEEETKKLFKQCGRKGWEDVAHLLAPQATPLSTRITDLVQDGFTKSDILAALNELLDDEESQKPKKPSKKKAAPKKK